MIKYVVSLLLLCAVNFCIASTPSVLDRSNADTNCYFVKKHSNEGKNPQLVKVCPKPGQTFEQAVNEFLSELTPAQTSVLEQRLEAQHKIAKTPFAVAFFEPTYILPFYYTTRPYNSVYAGHAPENQKILPQEFKAQMSFQLTLWQNALNSPFALNVAYTQLSYWQFYANSQWFRETDYEPSIFLSSHFSPNWLGYIGFSHQSNGEGGELERSWNRVYFDLMASGPNWLISFKPWIPVFKKDSSDLHNPDITKYLGYGRIVYAVTFHKQEVSFMVRNVLESGFKRGAVELDYSFPLYGRLRGFVQVFSGYGQSLIEYNHYTNGVGAGIILNNWI